MTVHKKAAAPAGTRGDGDWALKAPGSYTSRPRGASENPRRNATLQAHFDLGARKVEANALVVRPEAGRKLCRQAILRYLPEDAPADYQAALERHRQRLQAEILRQLQET
jgi:hypothetical protein